MDLPPWILSAVPFLGAIGALVALIFGAQWAQRRRKPPTVIYLPARPGVTPRWTIWSGGSTRSRRRNRHPSRRTRRG